LVDCVELDRRLVDTLIDDSFFVIAADFLQVPVAALGTYDRVLMNPPFEGGQDIQHVTHALDYLGPHGRLVSVMGAGVTFNSDRRHVAFRGLIDLLDGTIEPLPDDSFAASGTRASTVVVTTEKGTS
jgi:hypothetical protein